MGIKTIKKGWSLSGDQPFSFLRQPWDSSYSYRSLTLSCNHKTLKMKSTAFLLFFLSIVSQTLFSQACCSGGTPLSSNLGIQGLQHQQLEFQLSYDYNTQRALVSGSQKLDDDRRDRNTHSVLLRGSYAFSPKFSLTGLFSFVRQEEVIDNIGGRRTTTYAEGIGDAVAMLQYNLINNPGMSLVLAGGLTIPLGATDRLDPTTGITALHPDMQPGQGALDQLLGANAVIYNIFKPGMSWTNVLTYRLTSPADRFNGAQEYEFGNELQWITGLADSYFIGLWVVDPSLLFRYRNTAVDRVNGVKSANTGGNWLHLMPGLDVHFSQNWSIGLTGEIPLYRDLTGTQLTTSSRIRVNLRYSITPKQELMTTDL